MKFRNSSLKPVLNEKMEEIQKFTFNFDYKKMKMIEIVIVLSCPLVCRWKRSIIWWDKNTRFTPNEMIKYGFGFSKIIMKTLSFIHSHMIRNILFQFRQLSNYNSNSTRTITTSKIAIMKHFHFIVWVREILHWNLKSEKEICIRNERKINALASK